MTDGHVPQFPARTEKPEWLLYEGPAGKLSGKVSHVRVVLFLSQPRDDSHILNPEFISRSETIGNE